MLSRCLTSWTGIWAKQTAMTEGNVKWSSWTSSVLTWIHPWTISSRLGSYFRDLLYLLKNVKLPTQQKQARGHVPLKLGGGSTPFVAVLDTHAHWSYEAAYKDAEVHDSAAQLRRGSVLPCTSRQTVLSRAVDSWRQVQHDRVSEGWVAAGITNALDGSQDHQVSRVVLPFWAELQPATHNPW